VDARARRSGTLLVGTAAAVLALDQVTKAVAVATLVHGPAELIRGVLTLRYTTNTGGAFSLFTDIPWFFAAASIVVAVLIGAVAFRARPPLHAAALGMILGGALGNLADRAFRAPGLGGEVVDFIDLHVWPVFNLADSAIVLGAIALAVASFRSEHAAATAGEDA
jgi:signal peptidase II